MAEMQKEIFKADKFGELLKSLPPVFSRDPEREIAFTVDHTSGVSFTVRDGLFCTRVGSEFTFDKRVPLEGKTISQLVDELNGHAGYTATLASFGDKSALRLRDADEDGSGRVFVFTNLNWAIFQALAKELQDLDESIKETLRQMTMVGASGVVQDFWGSFAEVLRMVRGETDSQYGQRVVQAFLPKSNNVILEKSIADILGLEAEVHDLGWDANRLLLMNDEFTPVNDPAFCLHWQKDFKGLGTSYRAVDIIPTQLFMLMNDKACPVGDTTYVMHGAPRPNPWPCNTFGVFLLNGMQYTDLSPEEIYLLAKTVNVSKTASSKWKLYWLGAPGDVMFLNNPVTLFGNPNWKLWTDFIYFPTSGYLATELTYVEG